MQTNLGDLEIAGVDGPLMRQLRQAVMTFQNGEKPRGFASLRWADEQTARTTRGTINMAINLALMDDEEMSFLALFKPDVRDDSVVWDLDEPLLGQVARSLWLGLSDVARESMLDEQITSRVRTINTAIEQWKADHNQQWPDSLDEVFAKYGLDPVGLQNPNVREPGAAGYVYRKPADDANLWSTAVLWERYENWPKHGVALATGSGLVRRVAQESDLRAAIKPRTNN